MDSEVLPLDISPDTFLHMDPCDELIQVILNTERTLSTGALCTEERHQLISTYLVTKELRETLTCFRHKRLHHCLFCYDCLPRGLAARSRPCVFC